MGSSGKHDRRKAMQRVLEAERLSKIAREAKRQARRAERAARRAERTAEEARAAAAASKRAAKEAKRAAKKAIAKAARAARVLEPDTRSAKKQKPLKAKCCKKYVRKGRFCSSCPLDALLTDAKRESLLAAVAERKD